MNIKEKSVGFYLGAFSALVMAVMTVVYLVFSIGSNSFNGGILACLLIGIVCFVALFFYKGFGADFLGIVAVGCFTGALVMFLGDSVCDFADFIVKIQLFGNMDNAIPRFTIAVFMLISVLTGIVSCFLKQEKNN
ncbi:MAG: hypothetical protein J6D37_02740 [Clostridia bacterium]|nr:hypothetical protein [Clostridia bacterium]